MTLLSPAEASAPSQLQVSPSVFVRYSAALMVLLVIYASLFPFSSWRLQGVSPFAFVLAPWPKYWTMLDVGLNILGYVPLGALLFASVWPQPHMWRAFLLVVLSCSALSFAMESMQSFLSERVASNIDWVLNTLGAALGALSALVMLPRLPAAHTLYALRQRWFEPHASFGLWLLCLWPIALLMPQPVLLGTGDAIASLASWASGQMQGSTLFSSVAVWLAGWQPAGLTEPQQQAVPLLAVLGATLSLNSCFRDDVALNIKALLVLMLLLAASLATTLTYAMSYGPLHALEWLQWQSFIPMLVGVCMGLLLLRLKQQPSALLALVCLGSMLFLVNMAREDFYFTLTMQSWQQGRWIRLHGLTRWIAMLWPWVMCAYLARRLAQPEPVNPGSVK